LTYLLLVCIPSKDQFFNYLSCPNNIWSKNFWDGLFITRDRVIEALLTYMGYPYYSIVRSARQEKMSHGKMTAERKS